MGMSTGIVVLEFPSEDILQGVFIRRLNRFLGLTRVKNSDLYVHIHDPGRIPLLEPKTKVLIIRRRGNKRKTLYDLLAFKWGGEWIFSHSGYHSKIFENTIPFLPEFKGEIIREVRLGESRIDFMIGEIFVEVKGCTWIVGDSCYFPDAPTSRGRRHVLELARQAVNGGKAYIVFLAFSKYPKKIKIARSIDPNFGDAVLRATEAGVKFLGIKYVFDGRKLRYVHRIPVELS